jgi:hypothetical protein
VDYTNGQAKHFKFIDLDPEAKSLTRKSKGALIQTLSTGGYLYKKSGSWTEYFRLWGGQQITWKKKYILATNLGLLMFDES